MVNFDRLIEADIPEEDTIGYFGASVAAALHLKRTDVVPTSPRDDPHGFHSFFYFYPVRDCIPGHRYNNQFSTHDGAFDAAKDYAGTHERRTRFMQLLRIPISENFHLFRLLDEIGEITKAKIRRRLSSPMSYFSTHNELSEAYDRLRQMGKSNEDLCAALENCSGRKGLVMGLTRAALRFTVEDGCDIEKRRKDLYLVCPDGLPHDCVSGIHPLGEVEANELTDQR